MKRGAPDHPKMKAFARSLGIPIAYANGVLERLWHFAADYAPDGAIGKFNNADIAAECGFTGDPDVLITTLEGQDCRWLDRDGERGLIVHDWPDHCEDSVHCKLARSRKFFANGGGSKTNPPAESRKGFGRSMVRTKYVCERTASA